MALLLETTWGDLVIDLDIDGSPELCKNILKLAKVRYYTNTLIFSVTSNRFCQAGDPTGDGTGGSSIYGLTDDATRDVNKSKRRFVRSMGRSLLPVECRQKGRVVATNTHRQTPDTIGSQFLITTAEGIVTEDTSGVLDRINAAYTDPHGRPYADIRIIRALVIHDPFDDVPGMDHVLLQRGVDVDAVSGHVVRSPSPERPLDETVPKRISALEVTLDEDDNSEDDEARDRKRRIQDEEAAKLQDKSRAVVLEMLGDLPDADIVAPEDVLFICKLNPLTADDDLELIFSRFDEKVKVEIIRDVETGASLQYAFAEFTSKQAAVEAYFKMNNALVDDRRIKVDFSQSVAKLWNKYRQELRMPKTLDASITTGQHQSHHRHSHRNGGTVKGSDPPNRHAHSRKQSQHAQRSLDEPQPRHATHERNDVGHRDFHATQDANQFHPDAREHRHHQASHRHERRSAPNDREVSREQRREDRRSDDRYETRDRRDRSYDSTEDRGTHQKHKHDDRRRHRRERSDSSDRYRHKSRKESRRRKRSVSSDERRHKRSDSSDEDDRKRRKKDRKHRDRERDHKSSRHR